MGKRAQIERHYHFANAFKYHKPSREWPIQISAMNHWVVREQLTEGSTWGKFLLPQDHSHSFPIHGLLDKSLSRDSNRRPLEVTEGAFTPFPKLADL